MRISLSLRHACHDYKRHHNLWKRYKPTVVDGLLKKRRMLLKELVSPSGKQQYTHLVEELLI